MNEMRPPTSGRPLRIALCLSWYQPIESGAERQAHRQAVELIRRGHRVVVLTRAVPGQPTQESRDGVEIRRVIRPYSLGPLFGLTFVATLAYQLSRMRREIDVVHCHQAHWEAVAAGWLRRRTGIPTLVQPAAGGYYGEVEILQRTKGARWLRSWVLANAHFVAISRQIADELRGLGVPAEQLTTLASGIDTDEYAPGNSDLVDRLPSGPRVLFLGRLHPQKNLHVLLRAWQLVVAAHPDAVLLLAGDGPQRDELQQLACELGIDGRVLLLGQVDRPLPYLRTADVFVLPSISEGMSNSLLEAMSCGLPPVVSRAGGNVDLVQHEHNGLVVDTREPEPLAEALGALLADGTLRRRLGAAAREAIMAGYSLRPLVDRYEQLYRRLIASR